MSDELTLAEKMNLEHLPPSNRWRKIVEGPNFMAFPPKSLSEHGVTFHDAYVHKLNDKFDRGEWVPNREVDAFLRAQVFRMIAILQSDQLTDLLDLGETSEHSVTKDADEIVAWAVSEQRHRGAWQSMSDQEAAHFYHELIDRLRARCGFISQDPAVATVDKILMGPGLEMILDHTAAQAAGIAKASPGAAAYTAILICRAWGKSPFRQRIVDVAAF